MKEIGKALLHIKPSYEFRRTPWSIHTSKYWKVSEYQAWLLIYSIPVLLQVNFPADYLYHFSLLVSSIHILLGCNISQQHLQIAHCMLARFYELMPILYPQTMCSLNFIVWYTCVSLSVDGDPCGAIRRSDLKTSMDFWSGIVMEQGMSSLNSFSLLEWDKLWLFSRIEWTGTRILKQWTFSTESLER